MKLWILLIFLVIPLVSSQQETLGNFEQNSCVNLIQICGDCTYNNITTVRYPNSSIGLSNVAMTKTRTEFNYTYCSTSVFGEYIVNGVGDLEGTPTAWSYNFFITPNGEKLKGDGFNIFVFSLFGILLFLMLFTFVINITKISVVEFKILDLAWSWGIYFTFLFVYMLSFDYLVNDFIRQHMETVIKITGVSHILIPLIGFFVTFFIKITQKKKPLSPSEINGNMRGYWNG